MSNQKMHSNEPCISIITPSYNQGPFLEQTILSVLDQNYPDLEYLIMDGGSTDDSVEIIERYQNRLAYWVSKPDSGQSDAINKGFRRSTGEIVAWINSDDYYLPDTFSTVAKYFADNPDIDFVYGDLINVDQLGNRLFISKTIPCRSSWLIYGGLRIPQPACFFRGNVLDRVGYLNESLHRTMDIDFFIRCVTAGIRFGHIPQPLACFRIHQESKTQSVKRFREEASKVSQMYARRLFKNDNLHSATVSLGYYLTKAMTFATKAALRGDLLPFQTLRARKKVSRQAF